MCEYPIARRLLTDGVRAFTMHFYRFAIRTSLTIKTSYTTLVVYGHRWFMQVPFRININTDDSTDESTETQFGSSC